jgi:hypothetical protein
MSSNLSELQAATGAPPAVISQQALTSSISVQEQQAVARVKLQFYVAKTHPRDVNARLAEIKKLCAIPEVASDSEYSFPRGGQTVRGPNIRLAELIASNWHNFDYGLCEINRGNGSSLCEAYAIDMEANTAYRIQFNVPHRRDKNDRDGQGGSVELKTDRDIYENMANMGSRRLREAIFRVVPSFVVNAAVDACRATKEKADQKEPLAERIKVKLVPAFEKLGVTTAMLAAWLKCPVADMLEGQYQDLLVIWRTIKNNEGRIDDYFEKPTGAPQAQPAKTGGDAGEAGKQQADAKAAADGATNKGGNAKPTNVAKPAAARDSGAESGGGQGAGQGQGGAAVHPDSGGEEGEGGSPGFDEIKARIESATSQDHIDDIQSLMSNNPNLNKAQSAELRSKFKAKVSTMQME